MGAYRNDLQKREGAGTTTTTTRTTKNSEEAQHKAELIKAQALAAKPSDEKAKGVVSQHTMKYYRHYHAELDKIKANHEQRAERLEQKAQSMSH